MGQRRALSVSAGPSFAMLIGDLMLSFYAQARARLSSPHAARILTAVVVAVLAVRFGVFAKKAADSFPARTTAYQRFVSELRRANPSAAAGSTVVIDAHLGGCSERTANLLLPLGSTRAFASRFGNDRSHRSQTSASPRFALEMRGASHRWRLRDDAGFGTGCRTRHQLAAPSGKARPTTR